MNEDEDSSLVWCVLDSDQNQSTKALFHDVLLVLHNTYKQFKLSQSIQSFMKWFSWWVALNDHQRIGGNLEAGWLSLSLVFYMHNNGFVITLATTTLITEFGKPKQIDFSWQDKLYNISLRLFWSIIVSSLSVQAPGHGHWSCFVYVPICHALQSTRYYQWYNFKQIPTTVS